MSKGQRLGTMTVKSGEQILAQIPLVAQREVAKRTWGQMFLQILRWVAMSK